MGIGGIRNFVEKLLILHHGWVLAVDMMGYHQFDSYLCPRGEQKKQHLIIIANSFSYN
jgi:hypothetical protein